MEYSRESVLSLKQEIKQLAESQKELRNQRKSIHIKGDRTTPEGAAAKNHYWNQITLAHMYYAYAIMRGKTPIPFKHKEVNQRSVNKILDKYGKTVCA